MADLSGACDLAAPGLAIIHKGDNMPTGQTRLIDLLDDMSSGKDVFFRMVRRVEDAMTEKVKTLRLDDTLETSLKFMKGNKVRHIPVVDNPTGEAGKQCLVGVVSQRDVFRQISPYVGKIGQIESDLKALKQPITQIITRNPKCVCTDTTIADAITIMIDNHIDILPVLSGQHLTGVVSTTDILRLFVRLNAVCLLCRNTEKKQPAERVVDLLGGNSQKAKVDVLSVFQTVRDIMTEQPVCMESNGTLAKAMDIMRKGKFRHVPVVEKQKKLVGVISDRDILLNLPFRCGQSKRLADVFRDRLFDVALNEPAVRQEVRKLMKSDAACVLPDCEFHTAVAMLYDRKISCLPVVDQEKNLLGIVTVTDVMRGLLAAYRLFNKTGS